MFLLTMKQAWDLFKRQKGLCAISGVAIKLPFSSRLRGAEKQTASLDRIDSALPYELDNVQWVHKVVNIMKHVQSQETFVQWCNTISAYQCPETMN